MLRIPDFLLRNCRDMRVGLWTFVCNRTDECERLSRPANAVQRPLDVR
jgi:hypothetical protein